MLFHGDTRLLEFLCQRIVVCFEEICLNRGGHDLIIAPQKLLRLLRRQDLQQALHQPQRMAVSNGQILRRAAAADLRHIHPVRHKFTQHGVDHARRAGSSVPSAHLHRFVYGSAVGDLVHK